MGAIPDKVAGKMTYAQIDGFRLPWWADAQHMPNVIPSAQAKDVDAWLRAAGMEFTVETEPLYVRRISVMSDGSIGTGFVDVRTLGADLLANSRRDNGTVFASVSEGFKNVQPGELLAGFMDRIQSEHINLTTMGSMKKGRNIFIGCKLSDAYATQVGPDLVEAWLMLHTRFDGAGATIASISSVCPVCENTVEASMSEATRKGSLFRVPHRSIFDGVALREAIEAAEIEVKERGRVFNALVNHRMSTDDVMTYFAKDIVGVDPEDMLRAKPDGSPVIAARTQNIVNALFKSYNRGPGAQARIGNAWGAFQAVTNYVDNEASTRDTAGDGEHMARKFTAMYGRGKETKAQALKAVMTLAGVELAA